MCNGGFAPSASHWVKLIANRGFMRYNNKCAAQAAPYTAMPQDVVTLTAIVQELGDALVGGRIDRVTQPEKDEVFLHIRAKGRNHILAISVNPNAPRMHLTTVKKDNPYAAPAFLMHLRKHLVGGCIQSLAIVNCDRIVDMAVLGRNELYDAVSMHLYIELMGRYSNIIAVDGEGTITDALRHIPPDDNQLRAILPHLAYTLPPMGKIKPDDKAALRDYIVAYTAGDLAKYIFAGVAGMVNITVREVVYRAGLSSATAALTPDQIDALLAQIDLAFSACGTAAYAPCYSTQDGVPHDYYIYPYHTVPLDATRTDTLNLAAETCAVAKDRVLRLHENGKQLATAIRNAQKKVEKALAIAQQKLLECADYEQNRLYGELLTCNLYQLQKGQTSATVLNYYTGEQITIPMDSNKTPAENAQAYYRKYNKQKRTVAVAQAQVQEYTQTLQYLDSIQCAFALCEDTKDLQQIRDELQQAGYLRVQPTKGKVRKPAPVPPLCYRVDGVLVQCGKNNIQNEQLTFHCARESDIWMHVKAAHGSHVIIRLEGAAPSPSVLRVAAEIAAAYSDQCQGDKIEVDYTQRKYVKHHPGKKVGMVIYTDYKTIVVTPNKHHELQTQEQ